MIATKQPDGELTVQTLAMPRDTNANGDIFGGWILSQMDLASGVLAKKISSSRSVTVAVNAMNFLHPVHVGDILTCYAKLLKQGNSSMTIQVDVWTTNYVHGQQMQVTTGEFVCVAIDEHSRPKPLLSSHNG